MSDALDLVADLVLRESGQRIPPARYRVLQTAITRAFPSGDAASFLRIAGDPVGGARAIAKLIDELMVKETSFFRDRHQLDAIDWISLLSRAEKNGAREVRVWCAACATGEEAYTLALLACEAFGSVAPPVRILATDISNAALDAALVGRYRERSMRGVSASLRRDYFEQDEASIFVGERLRRLVHLAQHNLITDAMPPLGEARFDLILCRNVLIYLDSASDHVIAGLRTALNPEGTLLLGAADVLCGTAGRRVLARSVTTTPVLRPVPAAIVVATEAFDEHAVSEASFLAAIGELERGEAVLAVAALRQALFLDPDFALAAFALGRAHEATGDTAAARRAYRQALRTIDGASDLHAGLLEQVDIADVASACRARLAAL